MPLIDLSRQTKNTSDVSFDGTGSTSLKWVHSDIIDSDVSITSVSNINGAASFNLVSHGLSNGDLVLISNEEGHYNNYYPNFYTVTVVDNDSFNIKGSDGGTVLYEDTSTNNTYTTYDKSGHLKLMNSSTPTIIMDASAGDLYVGGNLDVQGQSVIFDSSTVSFSDEVLQINYTNSGLPEALNSEAGIQIGIDTGYQSGSTFGMPKFVFDNAIGQEKWRLFGYSNTEAAPLGELETANIEATTQVKTPKLFLSNNSLTSAVTTKDGIASAGTNVIATAAAVKEYGGALSSLTTDSDLSLVTALNEVDSHADTNATNISIVSGIVAGHTIDISNEVTARGSADDDLQESIDRIEESVGLTTGGVLESITGTNYLDGINTFTGIDLALDAAIYTVSGAVTQEATARGTADGLLQNSIDALDAGGGAYVNNFKSIKLLYEQVPINTADPTANLVYRFVVYGKQPLTTDVRFYTDLNAAGTPYSTYPDGYMGTSNYYNISVNGMMVEPDALKVISVTGAVDNTLGGIVGAGYTYIMQTDGSTDLEWSLDSDDEIVLYGPLEPNIVP